MCVCMTDGVGYFILFFSPSLPTPAGLENEKKPAPGLCSPRMKNAFSSVSVCVKRYTHNKFPLNNKK